MRSLPGVPVSYKPRPMGSPESYPDHYAFGVMILNVEVSLS